MTYLYCEASAKSSTTTTSELYLFVVLKLKVQLKVIEVMLKSKPTRKTRSDKLPLTLHPTGQYCKKIRGKLYYFGTDESRMLSYSILPIEKIASLYIFT
jgi:hypothetical protein